MVNLFWTTFESMSFEIRIWNIYGLRTWPRDQNLPSVSLLPTSLHSRNKWKLARRKLSTFSERLVIKSSAEGCKFRIPFGGGLAIGRILDSRSGRRPINSSILLLLQWIAWKIGTKPLSLLPFVWGVECLNPNCDDTDTQLREQRNAAEQIDSIHTEIRQTHLWYKHL